MVILVVALEHNMTLTTMTVKELRVLKRCIQSASMGLKDIMLVDAIDAEIHRRKT
jgi:hypothetical protein